MEKIALISDIHANIVALNKVLDDIEKRGISKIFCLGDLVLKGSSPCEVVDIIKEKCEIIIKGNCDDYAVYPNNNHKKWYNHILGSERIKFLSSLPIYYDVYISGSLVRMFHATKNNLNYRIFDNSKFEEKMKLFDDENGIIPDIVIYADIHKQYLEKIHNKTIINIGSVGNPLEISFFDDTQENNHEIIQAQYCIIEGEINCQNPSSLSIQFVKIPYDINSELILAKKNGSPDFDEYRIELTKGKYRGKSEYVK